MIQPSRSLRAAASTAADPPVVDAANPVRNPYLPLDNEHWAQLFPTPEDFVHSSFQTHALEDGVRMVDGELKATGQRVACAYCFASPQFTAASAGEWLSGKQIQPAKLDPARDVTYKQITAKAIYPPPTAHRPLPTLRFSDRPVTLQAEAGKGLPKLDILVYTGGAVQPGGWDYPIVVNVDGLEIPPEQTPILKDHSPDQVVGHGVTTKDGANVRTKGVVSGAGDAAREVLTAAANGFQWKSSIGCDCVGDCQFINAGEILQANGLTFTGPLYYWPRSILRETTITGRGADPNSRVSIAASAAKPFTPHSSRSTLMEFETWVATEFGLDPKTLSEPARAKLQAKYSASLAGGTALASDVDQAVALGKARMRNELGAEQCRLDRLNACYSAVISAWSKPELQDHDAKRKAAVELRAKAIANEDEAWSGDKIELEFMKLGRPDNVITNSRPNTGDLNAKVLEAAACRALMMPEGRMAKHFDAQTMEASARREFRNLGLKALLCQAASAGGWSGRWIHDDLDIKDCLYYAFPDRRSLRAEASTFQLPGILSNLANKYLYEGFWMVDDAWSKIAAKRPAADFKPVPGFRFYANMTFEKIGKNGEIPHGDVGELVYVNQAETYAKGITTTRQDIRNDDLSALSRIPQLIGMGAAYALNLVFWTVFLTGKDFAGNTLFSAGNKNLVTTNALSIAGLGAARQKFREQTKPDGQPLGFPPAVLLVPPALETTADSIYTSTELRQIVTALGSTSAAATQEVQTSNVFKGKFAPVTTPYIGAADCPAGTTGSDTAWYLFAAAEQLALMEIVFLDGQQTPTVQSSEADFDVLGISHRGFFDFGVKAMEYRGGVKNTP